VPIIVGLSAVLALGWGCVQGGVILSKSIQLKQTHYQSRISAIQGLQWGRDHIQSIDIPVEISVVEGLRIRVWRTDTYLYSSGIVSSRPSVITTYRQQILRTQTSLEWGVIEWL
jgi:hypothetical protein